MSGFDLSNFIASFFDEARDRLNSINQALVAFESGTLDNNGLVALRRDAHTIKGSALMLGVNDVGGMAHLFEDLMEELIEHAEWRTPAAIQFLYDVHDLLDKRLEDHEGVDLLDPDAMRVQYDAVLAVLQSGESSELAAPEIAFGESPHGQAEHLIADPMQLEDFTLSELPDENGDVHAADLATAASLSEFLDDNLSESDFELTDLPMSSDDDVLSNVIETIENADFSKPSDVDKFDLTDTSDSLGMHTAESIVKPEAVQNQVIQGQGATQTPDFVKERNHATASIAPLVETEFRPEFNGEETKGSGQRQASGRFLRVDAERLEDLSHHIIEMSTEQSRISKAETGLADTQVALRALRRELNSMQHLITGSPAAQPILSKIEQMMDVQVRQVRSMVEESRYQSERNTFALRELRDQVLGLMLRPLDSVFSTFPRAVRDVAARIGKRVHLVVDGKSVEMDQGVAESLVEPLVHLLNNAVAHGIEDGAERLRLGKPEEGQVTIVARQSGNEVRIEVIDDGRGIDTNIIKRVAVERGVTTQNEADLMDSAEIMEMIFRPGFSTHKEVDSLAGRGIGMNVVQDTIRRLTGSIRIHTELGKGSRFVISVPVSIAVQQALMFSIGDQTYGMLTHMIEQAVPFNKQTIEKGVGGKLFLSYDSHQVPIVDLRRMMLKKGTALSESPYIIVSEHIEGFVGIVVDDLLGDGEIVVRDLDPYIKRYQPQGLMGNTIAEDGSVVMLLEPYGIKEMGRTSPDQDIEIQVEDEDKLRFNILLVDDSLIAREIEKSIFESIGFVVETAIDGMDGLEKLEAGAYDMIVTDLEMPRLDGFGFVRRIRNQSEYEDMPVMVISTRESAEDRVRALEAGADSYMVKQHLDADSIIATVKALVGPLIVKERGIAAAQANTTETD